MPKQTKFGSTMETLWQFALGFALSYMVYEYLINFIVRGGYISYEDSFVIVLIVSLFSLLRQYGIRRCSILYNRLFTVQAAVKERRKAQRKRDSLFESVYQVLAGLFIYYFVYKFVILALIEREAFSADSSFMVTLILSFFSIIRHFIIRRMFARQISVYQILMINGGRVLENLRAVRLNWYNVVKK